MECGLAWTRGCWWDLRSPSRSRSSSRQETSETILGAAGGAGRRQEAAGPLGVGCERGAEQAVGEPSGLVQQAARGGLSSGPHPAPHPQPICQLHLAEESFR